MFAEDVILKPVLTEKGYDGIADKRYTFYVKNSANKIEIRSAVEKLYGVQRQAEENGQKRRLHARPQKSGGYPQRGQQAHRVLQLFGVIGEDIKNGY